MHLVCCKPKYSIYQGISSFPRIWRICAAEVLLWLIVIFGMTYYFCFYTSLVASTIEQIYLWVHSVYDVPLLNLTWIQRSWKSKSISDMEFLHHLRGIPVSNIPWSQFCCLSSGIGDLYSTAMWSRNFHGKWHFGLLLYHWDYLSSLYSFLFRRCAKQSPFCNLTYH